MRIVNEGVTQAGAGNTMHDPTTLLAIRIARFIAKRRGVSWRDLLSDVWVSVQKNGLRPEESGAAPPGAIQIVWRDLIDVRRAEGHLRHQSRTRTGLAPWQVPAREEGERLSWDDYRERREAAKLNWRERLYLYLWLIEGLDIIDLAATVGAGRNETQRVLAGARAKLGAPSIRPTRRCREYVEKHSPKEQNAAEVQDQESPILEA